VNKPGEGVAAAPVSRAKRFRSNAKYFGQQREAKNDKKYISRPIYKTKKLEFFASSEVNR